jgi:3-deoxy-7-phosphoheptulonate synthase
MMTATLPQVETRRPGVRPAELPPYRQASRAAHAADTVITVNGVHFGGPEIGVIAGPCAVESRTQTFEIAAALSEQGVRVLRGGAYKPRTSPYAFQGLGRAGLEILAEAGRRYGMAIITEVMTPEELPAVREVADILQVGSRNMQNYRLLEAVGQERTPVLLKRGMSATIEEWLLAAEYILAGGNAQVMLCERGIRTFEPLTRFTFDINAIPLLKQLTHLPVIADPSHATGHADLVAAVARGAIAAGADGLIVEVHTHPEEARSDGPQQLRPAQMAALLADLRALAPIVGRTL